MANMEVKRCKNTNLPIIPAGEDFSSSAKPQSKGEEEGGERRRRRGRGRRVILESETSSGKHAHT